jgi:hydrogenase maturation protein HypF
MPARDVSARSIHVRGVVQGVGFRVFVHRLARARGLAGWVLNAGEGVEIHVEGDVEALDDFMHDLRTTAPPGAVVTAIETSETSPMGAFGFEIRKSRAR